MNEMNEMNKWLTALDQERGKADPDDMSWWRDTSTSLDENIRVEVYDWDADATDTLVMTRRRAVIEGHLKKVTRQEADLLAAEGVRLPADVEIIEPPQPTEAESTEAEPTLADVVARYGSDLAGVEVRDKLLGRRIVRIVSVTPTAIEAMVEKPSGGEVQVKYLPSAKVIVTDTTPATGAPDDVDSADEELDRLMDEVAAAEQRQFEQRAAAEVEAQMAEDAQLDELHPLSYFESLGLAKASTLRRAALDGRLQAEKIGHMWFTTERDVRRFLAQPRRRRGIRLTPHVRVWEEGGTLVAEIGELNWTGWTAAHVVPPEGEEDAENGFMPLFPLAHVQLRFRDEGFDREYETTVVDDPRLKIVRVVRSYDYYGRRERNYYFYEVLGDAEVHVIPDTD